MSSHLVFGASSQIGRFLLPRLLAAGDEVVAVSRVARDAPPSRNLRWLQAALPELPDEFAQRRFASIVSFGPLDGLAQWLAKFDTAPAPALVATSSMSAESKRESAVEGDRALSQRLRDGEDALKAQCARLGIDFAILRPTLIYGAGLDKSLTPIARRAMKWRAFPLPQAHGLRQPVHADDIAQAVVAALNVEKLGGITVQIGGGERIEYAEMFRRVRASLGVATLPLPVPLPALRAAAFALPKLRGPVSRLQQDLLADNGELQRVLGVRPRAFHPDATMWQEPTS